MSLHSVKAINNLNDPLKMFLCKFTLSFPTTALPEGASSTFADELEMRAQTFNLPKIVGDVTDVTWGGHNRQYAGKQQRQGDWTVKFTEVYNGDIITAFTKWANLYHKYLDGTISLFNEYSKSIEVDIHNPNFYVPGAKQNSLKLRLLRAWPKEVSASEIDPNSSNPVEVTVTFHYDYFLVEDEINKAEGTGTEIESR